MTVTLSQPALAAWIAVSVTFGIIIGAAVALDWVAGRDRPAPIRVRPSYLLAPPAEVELAPHPADTEEFFWSEWAAGMDALTVEADRLAARWAGQS